jgi:hypothetical protein
MRPDSVECNVRKFLRVPARITPFVLRVRHAQLQFRRGKGGQQLPPGRTPARQPFTRTTPQPHTLSFSFIRSGGRLRETAAGRAEDLPILPRQVSVSAGSLLSVWRDVRNRGRDLLSGRQGNGEEGCLPLFRNHRSGTRLDRL